MTEGFFEAISDNPYKNNKEKTNEYKNCTISMVKCKTLASPIWIRLFN